MVKKKQIRNGNNKNGVKVTVYKVDSVSSKEEKRAKRDKTIQAVLIVLIVVLAIAAVFSAIQTFVPDLFGRFSLAGELAAKVNGKAITMQQLNDEYDRLPLQYKYFITKEALLQQIIDETLMINEASRQGLKVDDSEIDASLAAFMQQNNVTQDKLDEILKAKKLTYDQLRELVKNQLLVDKLLKAAVTGKVNVTTELELQYYNDNPDTFKIPELVTVKHILIGVQDKTETEAEKLAHEVLNQIAADKSNFCALVEKYSDDAGSLEKCGEYTFPRGQMVVEFEDVAFTQGLGKISIVKTDFGYHVLWTINKTAEQIMKFSDVQEQINLVLAQQQEKMIYSELIVQLRNQSRIINYYEAKMKAEADKKAAEEARAAEAVSEEQPASQTEEGQLTINIEEPQTTEETTTTTTTEEPAAPAVGAQINAADQEVVDEQSELEEEVEPVIEEIVTVPAETIVNVNVPTDFYDCLKSKGAVLYGAYWDSSTKTQKSYFGADMAKINYIECGVQGDYRAQASICKEAGILAYPTWIINNEKVMGIQTTQQLSQITGCTA
ncbi:peptidylprolyl isomerase [Candidatus Woesearchaeota archaeon]|nr:peptidylprolyl isomerase [Candidatus Woesearchaeota archaeon]